MAKVRVGYGHLSVGKPLPFDLLDENGRVLLCYGYKLQSEAQVERLVSRGVYFELIEEESEAPPPAERVSVYSRVVETIAAFEKHFADGVANINYKGIAATAGDIQDLCALDSNPVLASILLHRSSRYSLRHAFGTAVLTEVLLRQLDRDETTRRAAVAGALSMNLAMMDLQDALYSQNEPLTPEQKRGIVTHPLGTAQLLRNGGVDDQIWLDVAEHHHEMLDGSGYAKRLSGPALSIEAQAVSLADRFCAMVSERAYRPGTKPDLAVKELLSRQAATVDRAVAAAFASEMSVYPPGTVVALANGEVAVVVKRTLNASQPVVRALRAPSGVRHGVPPKRLTSKTAYAIREVLDSALARDFDLAALWPPVVDEGDEDDE